MTSVFLMTSASALVIFCLSSFKVPNDTSLLYGFATNVYTPTAAGLDALLKAGLRDKQATFWSKQIYGPKNRLFLAYGLAVRNVWVWLEEVARSDGCELESWHDGDEPPRLGVVE